MVKSPEDCPKYTWVDRRCGLLSDAYWPGPLTIVSLKKETVPGFVTSDLTTVGIMCHDCGILNRAIGQLGRPVVCTSANTSGKGSPFDFAAVLGDVVPQLRHLMDGGWMKYA